MVGDGAPGSVHRRYSSFVREGPVSVFSNFTDSPLVRDDGPPSPSAAAWKRKRQSERQTSSLNRRNKLCLPSRLTCGGRARAITNYSPTEQNSARQAPCWRSVDLRPDRNQKAHSREGGGGSSYVRVAGLCCVASKETVEENTDLPRFRPQNRGIDARNEQREATAERFQ